MKLTTSGLILLGMMGIATFAKADHHGAFRAAKEECRKSVGVEKGKKKSEEQRQQLKACLSEKGFDREKFKEFRTARLECRQGLGLERGQRPSEDQRMKMKSCLEAKGYKRPDKRHGGQV